MLGAYYTGQAYLGQSDFPLVRILMRSKPQPPDALLGRPLADYRPEAVSGAIIGSTPYPAGVKDNKPQVELASARPYIAP